MVDYYAILGVRSDATLDEIKRAFRAAAMRAHPDRGGSHEAMSRLNEAWSVLSDTAKRAAYDLARAPGAAPAARADWEHKAQNVRDASGHYPGRWSDFDAWLSAVGDDVTRAQYGRGGAFLLPPMIEKSVTGTLLLLAGCVWGAFLAWSTGYWLVVLEQVDGLYPRLLSLAMPCFLGGWLGYWVHSRWREAVLQRRQTREQTRTQRSETHIVVCSNCGQHLRLPETAQKLSVTCTTCKARFDWSAPTESDVGAKQPHRGSMRMAWGMYGAVVAIMLCFLMAAHIRSLPRKNDLRFIDAYESGEVPSDFAVEDRDALAAAKLTPEWINPASRHVVAESLRREAEAREWTVRELYPATPQVVATIIVIGFVVGYEAGRSRDRHFARLG